MANTSALLRSPRLRTPASQPHAIDEIESRRRLSVACVKQLIPNGLTRGSIAEITGQRSSGRASVCFPMLAEATRQGEVCAVVDLFDSFYPGSAQAIGVQIEQLVWVRCHGNAEHALRAVDLLLHAGGFGIVLLDLCEASPRVLNRIPLSYWHRFRRAVENTPTILLLCSEYAQAKSCAGMSLDLKCKVSRWAGNTPFPLFQGLEISGTSHKGRSLEHPQPLFVSSVA